MINVSLTQLCKKVILYISLLSGSCIHGICQGLPEQQCHDVLVSAINKYSNVHAIEGKLTVKAHLTDKFLELNPSDPFTSVSPHTEAVNFVYDGSKYRFDGTSRLKDGTAGDIVTMTYDGDKSYLLTKGAMSYMQIKSGRRGQSPGTMSACGALLLPFSFLEAPTNDIAAGPIINPDTIQSFAKIPEVKLSLVTVKDSIPAFWPFVVKAEEFDSKFEVHLPLDGKSPPTYVRKINKAGLPIYDYEVRSFTRILNRGEEVMYPSDATINFYIDGMKIAVYDLVITDLKVNPSVDEAAFTLDPAEADLIYDVDNKTDIEVPK